MPVAIELEESFTISVPEIAGFITGTTAVGQQQLLNLRKPKLVVWNTVPPNLQGNVNISSNEVNPAASVSIASTQQYM